MDALRWARLEMEIAVGTMIISSTMIQMLAMIRFIFIFCLHIILRVSLADLWKLRPAR